MATVLVVDDSKFIRLALTEALKSFGHNVIAEAGDGAEGFTQYKTLHPDLVLLDITMPNRDGRACLQDILKANPAAKVVMISAIKEQSVVEFCLSEGAKGFIEKPLLFASDDYMRRFESTISQALDGE